MHDFNILSQLCIVTDSNVHDIQTLKNCMCNLSLHLSASSVKSAVQLDDVVMCLPTRSVPTPTSLGSPSTLSGSFPLSDCFRIDQQHPSALHVGGCTCPFLVICCLIVFLLLHSVLIPTNLTPHTTLSLSNFSLGYSCFLFTGVRTSPWY